MAGLRSLFLLATLVAASSSWLVRAQNSSGLAFDYYGYTCGNAEAIIREIVSQKMVTDPRMGASLLRLHFHDCFVEGCDGSILIDSTPGNQAEKDFPANNPSVRGYEVIDEIKARLEDQCPGVVSCADIVAYAARDGVALSGGPSWDVKGGRRDGRVSLFLRPASFLPPPTFSLTQLRNSFAAKSLNDQDLVALSAGHTIGGSHCSSFTSRLYNFTGKGDQDPSLNPGLAKTLKQACPQGQPDGNTIIPMDSTPQDFDTRYFTGLRARKGLFTSDAELLQLTTLVRSNMNRGSFFDNFIQSMLKMSEIEVKTGSQGEIRTNCRKIN